MPAASTPAGYSIAQEATRQKTLPPLNRFSHMVQEYFVSQVRQIERQSLALQEALKTKEDAEKYVKSVQEKIRECFGPEPKRTPLNPKVTGVVERDTFKIEKVVFESRPEFYVTANLYIPKNKKFPLPAVVGVVRSLGKRQGGGYLSGLRAIVGSAWLCRSYIRSNWTRGTAAIRERTVEAATRDRCFGTSLCRESAVFGGGVFWCVARMGWDSGARLFADSRRGRSPACRDYGQFRGWHDDHLALRLGPTLDDGSPWLFCDDLSPQLGKRIARRYGTVSAASTGRGA